MPQIIDFIGQKPTLANYKENYRDQHQRQINTINIDPCLRQGFNCTPHEDCDQQLIVGWWDNSFIFENSCL